jgi:hypothetical protein
MAIEKRERKERREKRKEKRGKRSRCNHDGTGLPVTFNL